MDDNKKTKSQLLDELTDLRRQVRKQVKLRKALEESEKKYRTVLENIGDGFYEVDLTGKYTYVNPIFCRYLGCSPDEMISQSYRKFMPTWESAQSIFKIFNEIYRTGIPAKLFNYQIIRKDGEIRDLESSASLLRDTKGNPVGFQGISRDVTEQKRIAVENERYRDFFENIEESCFEQDLAGNYTFINEAACRRFGYTREEILGMNFRDLTTLETAEKLVTVFNQVYRTGTPSELLDIEVFDKGKKPISIQTMASLIRDPAGKPIGFRGFARNITERKKIEADKERYRDFVENITDGCIESDLAGNTTFVNEAACRMFGFTREELIGMNNRDRITPETAKRIFKVFNEIYRTGIPAKIFDYEVIRKDGEIRHLEVSGSLIKDQAGKPIGFRGVIRDITERKKMEAEQEKYREFFENATDGFYELDLRGTITFANQAVCRMIGYSLAEFKGMDYRSYTSPETAKKIFAIYNEVYRTGRPAEKFEYEIIHKEQEIHYLETSASLIRDLEGKPIGFRGITRDITERKKMELEQERYREFFENASDACFELDLSGAITFVNDAACRMFGFPRKELIGLKNRDYTTPETAKRVFQIFNEIYRTGQPSEVFEYEIIQRGKEIRTLQTVASLIRDSDGKPIGFRGITREVTERKKMEAENERYREFVENIADGCYEQDLEGNYTFINEAACRRFGYTREEFVGLSHRDISSPETAKKMFKVFNEVYRTGLPSGLVETENFRKDGQVIYIQTMASLIRDSKGNPVGYRGVSRDVTELKKMEAEQERYRNFIENITDGVWENDLAGNMTFVNEATCRMFGYSREELMGMNNRAYTSPETAKRTFKMFNEIYRTGTPAEVFDYEIIRKDGEICYLQMSASLIRDKEGKPVGFRGISRDITERKKMMEEQARSRDFVENIEDGCWETDLAGNITFTNESACRTVGYTREEFLGLNNRAIATPEGVKKTVKMFAELYQTGNPIFLDAHEVKRKDGGISYLDMSASLIRDNSGKPVGFRGISRDVTERKKMMEEQARSRAFVENISDGCFEVDLAGNMTFVNDAACRMFGYPREEFLGMNNRDYTSPETAKRTFKIFNEIYRTGSPAEIFDYEIIRKDGEIRYLQISASLIRDSAGKPIGFRGISRDVTERKKMEAETARLTEQLNQARKLEAIGTLAGGIAHEFNNMLMGIQGYTSLILLDVDTSHPFYEKLKAIEAQVINASGLTGQLLGYARGGRYEIKATNLNELISKTASMFGRMKKEIIIHQTLDKALWTIDADQGQLEQVFLHLFMNSWQAMPAGGALYLQTENVMLDESYVKSYETQPGPYVKISVTDTGMGMDASTKDRIFEPFFTTKEMGRGAGLGLASAYGIIRGHGGIINVYSEKGYGTTFNIYLPASKKEAIPEKLPAREIMNRKETILLVDDEKVITDVAGAMITRLGYQLQIARNGEEAVEMYQADPDRIDLVIMDMIMPGIGGGKAFELIQSINPQARIILSSGFSLNGEAKEIMNRGAKAFLQKPFLIDDLSRVIREVVEAP